MKYQVIPRKFRPLQFKEVIGQTAVVQTLKNAIIHKKTAHAYLFSGSRGTGKTTLARLLAKSLNCQNLIEGFEPCNECTICQEINRGQSLYVIEIDGASNRGIDDIRQINEDVRFSSDHQLYKIYIIDEVHMLTKEAFNALLKTLEEPPSHVKFFFATTEYHKIPQTITSRCQCFYLKRLSLSEVKIKLEKIIQQLQLFVSEEALFHLAKLADGSLRDAESMLEQMIAFKENNISLNDVSEMFGLLDPQLLFELDAALFKQDLKTIASISKKTYQEGIHIPYFIDSLIDHYRNVLVTFMGALSEDIPKLYRKKYEESKAKYTEEDVMYIIDILCQALQKTSLSQLKHLHVEALLFKITHHLHQPSLSQMMQKLTELENTLKNLPSLPSVSNSSPPEIKSDLFDRPLSPQTIITHDKPKIISSEIGHTPIKDNNKKKQSRYDTILEFARIELEGSLKKKVN